METITHTSIQHYLTQICTTRVLIVFSLGVGNRHLDFKKL